MKFCHICAGSDSAGIAIRVPSVVGKKRPGGKPDPLPGDPTFPKSAEDTVLINDDSRYPNDHNFPQ